MRDHYHEFQSRGVEILAVGPDDRESFKRYWAKENLPFIGLPDPEHAVARLYRQEVNLFKLGRMPLNCIVDLNGSIRYVHYSASRSDIPDNETFLSVIDQLNESSKLT
ncbi:MAG: thioredoxin peroxidase [Chloroflexi bacterium]|nr:thioredoxin peroxidase [Chloroflexota bacterium]MDL1943274.1 redoxin domain-containing protein [Chloroflexi bacterium CFX2]